MGKHEGANREIGVPGAKEGAGWKTVLGKIPLSACDRGWEAETERFLDFVAAASEDGRGE